MEDYNMLDNQKHSSNDWYQILCKMNYYNFTKGYVSINLFGKLDFFIDKPKLLESKEITKEQVLKNI